MTRPTWNQTFMDVADVVAKRATCPRAQVGAVITKNNRIIGTGYNGAPSGMDHCLDVGCHVVANHCVRSIHAELNAIHNSVVDVRGATLYTTHQPCWECSKSIIQRGIRRVVYRHYYGDDRTPFIGPGHPLAEAGIELVCISTSQFRFSVDYDTGEISNWRDQEDDVDPRLS